ncbi:hypothetical protein Tco_0938378 [Tanacetum coccineum]|uniref:Reverse transcriptase domain-containing protein n=1 Tax=Tanacetum coccineum TaxID=301880 RepID=A0ABQ5DHZ4_9ASTR
MVGNQKRSSGEQNLSANREGRHKCINGMQPGHRKHARLGAIIGMIRGNTNRKRLRKQLEPWTDNEISFPSMAGSETKAKLKESRTPLVGFSGEVSYPIGTITLSVTMGERERLRTIPMEFAVVKSNSPYNVILGRTGLRNLRVVASTIRSMIKFPTANGIATITTKRETLYECRRMEEVRGPAREGRITFPQTQSCDAERITNRGREESPGQTDKVEEPDGTIQPSPTPSKKDTQTDEKGMGKGEPHQKSLEDKPPEKVVIHDDYPDQTVIIGGNLSAECRSRLVEILQAYVDDMVIKSKTEPEMIKDVEETLLTLKKVNMKLNPKKCSFGIVEGKFLGYIVTSEGIRANPEKAKAVVNMPSPSNLKQMQRLSGKLAALNRFIYKATERALPCLDTLRKCTNKKDFYWTTEVEEAFQAMKKLITELATLTAPKKEE